MEIGFGILGAGRISTRFAKVLKTVEGVRLAAVAAREKARAEAFAAPYAGAAAYGGYDALLLDPAVDVVYIGLPHSHHADAIRKCLMAGKAVLCEKPMVLTRRDAEELTALARERGVFLMEAMWSRFLPAFSAAKAWVAAGKIGRLAYVRADFCGYMPFDAEDRLFDPKLAGGALYDVGVYPIEFCMGLLGVPQRVCGVADIGRTGVDEYAAVSMSFPGGVVANVACGFNALADGAAYLYGSDGFIKLHKFWDCRRAERYDSAGVCQEVFTDEYEDGFCYEIAHVRDLLCAGRTESEIMPLSDTIACAGIFDTLMAQWGLPKTMEAEK